MDDARQAGGGQVTTRGVVGRARDKQVGGGPGRGKGICGKLHNKRSCA